MENEVRDRTRSREQRTGGPGTEPARAQCPAGGAAQDAILGVVSEGVIGAVLRFSAVTEAQEAIRDILAGLRQVQGRLARLCAKLPEPSGEFEPLAELRGMLECVSSDLLCDAITTLEAGSGRDVLGLLVDYLNRQLRRRC